MSLVRTARISMTVVAGLTLANCSPDFTATSGNKRIAARASVGGGDDYTDEELVGEFQQAEVVPEAELPEVSDEVDNDESLYAPVTNKRALRACRADRVHPLQPGVSRSEVNYKLADLLKPGHGDYAGRLDDLVDYQADVDHHLYVIVGPPKAADVAKGRDFGLYIIDGHHDAHAYLSYYNSMAQTQPGLALQALSPPCHIYKNKQFPKGANFSGLSDSAFRRKLLENGFVWKYDNAGKAIPDTEIFNVLPDKVTDLPNDKCRGFAYFARKEPYYIYAKKKVLFQEFMWANLARTVIGEPDGACKLNAKNFQAFRAYVKKNGSNLPGSKWPAP